MQTLQAGLLVLQVFIALGLIVIILVQHGKGADAGAAFGSGASSTMFGSRGSGNFLTRTTTALAVVFLANSMTLGYLAVQSVEGGSLMERSLITDDMPMPDQQTAPAPTAPAGDEMPAIPGQ